MQDQLSVAGDIEGNRTNGLLKPNMLILNGLVIIESPDSILVGGGSLFSVLSKLYFHILTDGLLFFCFAFISSHTYQAKAHCIFLD